MKKWGGRGFVLVGVTCSTALSWNSHASACSPPPPDVVHVAPEIPQGGLILGQLQCEDCTTDDLVFRTSAGEVAGSFVTISGLDDPTFFAFEPTDPIPVSSQDDPLFVGFDDGNGRSVLVVASNDEEPSAKSTLSSASEYGGTRHMCEEYSSTIGGLCGPPTYSSQTLVRAALEIDVEHGSQYFYRATYSSTEGEKELVGLLQDVSRYVFEGAPEEVCYRLERTAVDGSTAILAEECTSTEDLELGTFDRIFGDEDMTLGYCIAPPEGKEDDWCAHFAEAIAKQDCEGQPQDGCEAALLACDADTTDSGDDGTDETTTTDADSDTDTDDSGDDGTTGESDETGSTAGEEETGSGESTTDKGSSSDAGSDENGCSVHAPSRPSMKTAWLALPYALLLLLSVRRRSRRSADQ